MEAPFEDVTRYFQAADLLVMPYRRISQSGVLFLALSLGLPVVATSVGALLPGAGTGVWAGAALEHLGFFSLWTVALWALGLRESFRWS